ncbi:CCA tRNA nucleotidyltransferase 1, mitochondrial [Agrilus planipennis]|uniref:CCA tRNA nucleotidyltransferase 1, mitochondrial n=1 Tax=Agrilus planipennis TaxID=224129 RepID=A0A1W4WS05_AGRPL|nr:CCA tRNA nucleotidyltransferase 1, mitochondrial [Agrilus planipennis]
MNFCKLLRKTIKLKSCVRYLNNYKTFSKRQRIEEIRKTVFPKSRKNPVIMKLETPEFKSIFTDELNLLIKLFKDNGFELRVAGGAVRDLLMGNKPKDLDFATTATPDQMKELFTNEGIRMINMKGEKHGTITARINDKENFEITTLRVDLVTDGRHADVQFTTDWLLDANRRDLTINSMYLCFDGTVIDYFYGYEDLKKRRVCFVGDAETRIIEDYLRILRYFRFFGRISERPDTHEEVTLEAIRKNASGLGQVSGERIWVELKQILEGNFAGELALTILDCGIGPYIGLPNKVRIDELQRVWGKGKHLSLKGITLLTSLLSNEEDALALHNRLKLSAYERDLALFIIQHRAPKPSPDPLLPYQKLVVLGKGKDIKDYVIQVLKYNNSPYIQDFESWIPPKFPVTGTMLKDYGVESGKFMGAVLSELKEIWAESKFNKTIDELLKDVPHIVSTLKERKKVKQ